MSIKGSEGMTEVGLSQSRPRLSARRAYPKRPTRSPVRAAPRTSDQLMLLRVDRCAYQ